MMVDTFVTYLRYERNYSEETISNYQCDLLQVEKFLLEMSNLDMLVWENVQSSDINEWVAYLMDSGYMSSTVRIKLSSLRSFFKYLLRCKVILKDPMQCVVAPKKSKKLPAFLREQEVDQLLDEVSDDTNFEAVRDQLIIQFFYMTGVRVSEMLNLIDVDVDFLRNSIRVLGKRNKERDIPFGEELFVMMKSYVKMRDGILGVSLPQRFFVRLNGEAMTYSQVLKIVRFRLSKVSSLKKRSPHVLRHTFATAMMNSGADIAAVQALLGHASLATTQIYTHTTFEELKKVYNQAHPRN
ncbi:MAG: tyrosine-type recombinase/integrase [Bacteroidaceae bacterium]